METFKKHIKSNNQPRIKMTRDKFIKQYGETNTKDVAGILHNYLIDGSMEKHISLEHKIKTNEFIKLKDSIHILDELFEFEE
jgi:UDP-N-acetylglucosamine transferase subunit ALG13